MGVKVTIPPGVHPTPGELDHHISAVSKFRSFLSLAGNDAGVRTIDKSIAHLRLYQEILVQAAAQEAEYLEDIPTG